MRAIKYRTKLVEQRAVLEKEISVNLPELDDRMNTPEKVIKLAKEFLRMHEETEEYVYMVCLNTKLKMVGVFELSHGTVNSSIIGIREMFQKALLANAVNVIVLHNHPSGDPSPSPEDISITEKMRDAGKLIGVGLLDHIIIGGTCTSLKEAGYI